MKKLILIFCLFPLMAPDCSRKEGPDCHKYVYVRNATDNKIIFAMQYRSGDECILDGMEVQPGADHVIHNSSCWENALNNGGSIRFYIADPDSFTDQVKVPCDSIMEKYPILKYYNLTLEDIRALDFRIIYE
jgi:hypothetical protein